MENQITTNSNALKLFFTEDVFLVADSTVVSPINVSLNPDKEGFSAPADPEKNNYAIPTLAEESKAETTLLEEPQVNIDFKFLGGNKKSVLILVHDSQFEVSSVEGRELLRKIVKAINLATSDFALVNYAQYQSVGFEAFQQFFKPKFMLAFGVSSQSLNIPLAWNGDILNYQDTQMIFAPNLHPLDSNIQEKKMLWANLQKLGKSL